MYFSDIVIILLFFLMLRRPPISTRTDTLFPDTTLFRSGTLDLPHAQTHTVVLPHALAYNARAVPDAMRVLRIALGHDDPPTALYELARDNGARSEEHRSELQSLMRNSYAVFCLKKKKQINTTNRQPRARVTNQNIH